MSRYTCFTNAYLVLPSGRLTSTLSSLTVDASTGKIVHIGPSPNHAADHESPHDDDVRDWAPDSPPLSEEEGLELGVASTPGTEWYLESRLNPSNTTTIDLDGQILAPGLIDIQINGAFDVDFSEFDGDETKYLQGVDKVSRGLTQTGVTSYLPTVIVSLELFVFLLCETG